MSSIRYHRVLYDIGLFDTPFLMDDEMSSSIPDVAWLGAQFNFARCPVPEAKWRSSMRPYEITKLGRTRDFEGRKCFGASIRQPTYQEI